MEALELVDQEMKNTSKTPNIMLLGLEPPLYILWILKSIKPSEIEQSILILPIQYVERLIHYIILLLRLKKGIEMCSRIAILLIKTHYNNTTSNNNNNNTLSIPIRELCRLIKYRLNE